MLTTALLKRLTDVGIILAVSASIAFIVIAGGNSMVAKATLGKSYTMWMNFVTRPDIVVTTILAVIVTMAVSNYNMTNKR